MPRYMIIRGDCWRAYTQTVPQRMIPVGVVMTDGADAGALVAAPATGTYYRVNDGEAKMLYQTDVISALALLDRAEPLRPRVAELSRPSADDIVGSRNRAGMSQAAAARVVGVSLRTWVNWEAGRHKMSRAAWAVWRAHVSGLDARMPTR